MRVSIEMSRARSTLGRLFNVVGKQLLTGNPRSPLFVLMCRTDS